MSNQLQPLIENIIKYGLSTEFQSLKHTKNLQVSLTNLYLFCLNNHPLADDFDYPEFERNRFKFIEDNVRINFPQLGDYKIFLDIKDLSNFTNITISNACKDLISIIYDLLEIQWRMEAYSLESALDTAELLFDLNTKTKILHLLNYINQVR